MSLEPRRHTTSTEVSADPQPRRRPWIVRSGVEDGQALVPVMVLLFIAALAGFTFARTVGGVLNNTGNVVATSQARTLAEAGVADAMFRIDQQGSSPATFCVGASSCTVASIPGAPGVNYTATYANSAFTIKSEGVSHGKKYAIQQTVAWSPGDFAYAMFGVNNLHFSGDTTTVRATNSVGMPTGGPAPVGTSGSVLCSQGNVGTEQDIYGGGTGCANTVHKAGTYTPDR